MTGQESADGKRAGELVQLVVPVRDLDEAADFYIGLLKLPELFRAPNVIALAAGRTRILLTLSEDQAGRDAMLPYFGTVEIDEDHARLVAGGAEENGAPHRIATLGEVEIWVSQLRDPNGNLIGLLEERMWS